MATITTPTLMDPMPVSGGWTVLPSFLPVPGQGVLAVNSFLLKGEEPLLVDTGLAALRGDYLDALESEIDLKDLRWIWLSHMDADHIGNLQAVLDRAPDARVVTNFLGMGKMNLAGLDVGRVTLLDPGARLEVGGRCLIPVRPPYYDAPETIGFIDRTAGVFFAADSFGALLPEPATSVAMLDEDTLKTGMTAWSAIDSPWLESIDRRRFAATLDALRRMAPRTVLSSHLPLARQGVSRLARIIEGAWCYGQSDREDALTIDRLAPAPV